MFKGEKYGSYCQSYRLSRHLRADLVVGVTFAIARTSSANSTGAVHHFANPDCSLGLWNNSRQLSTAT
jgi:hypothetical protein